MAVEHEYYVMSGEGPLPAAIIAEDPYTDSDWYSGAIIDEAIAAPLVYGVDAHQGGHLSPLYDDLSAPVLRHDLLSVLVDAGVDNLQVFPAVIVDPGTGAQHTNYSAFNVVGVVAAADMQRSRVAADMDPDGAASREPDASDEAAPAAVDFESLVLDVGGARGLLLFRLAESVGTIIVHASVRRRIEQSGIAGIAFYGADE